MPVVRLENNREKVLNSNMKAEGRYITIDATNIKTQQKFKPFCAH